MERNPSISLMKTQYNGCHQKKEKRKGNHQPLYCFFIERWDGKETTKPLLLYSFLGPVILFLSFSIFTGPVLKLSIKKKGLGKNSRSCAIIPCRSKSVAKKEEETQGITTDLNCTWDGSRAEGKRGTKEQGIPEFQLNMGSVLMRTKKRKDRNNRSHITLKVG